MYNKIHTPEKMQNWDYGNIMKFKKKELQNPGEQPQVPAYAGGCTAEKAERTLGHWWAQRWTWFTMCPLSKAANCTLGCIKKSIVSMPREVIPPLYLVLKCCVPGSSVKQKHRRQSVKDHEDYRVWSISPMNICDSCNYLSWK